MPEYVHPLVPGDRIQLRQQLVRGVHAPDVMLGQRTTATLLSIRNDDWIVAVLDRPTTSGLCMVQLDVSQAKLVCPQS